MASPEQPASIPSFADSLQDVCAFLGARSDPATRYAYPSLGNCCHRASPAGRIDFSYQEAVCLSPSYQHCQLLEESWTGALPDNIRFHGRRTAGYRQRIIGLVVFILLLLAACVAILGNLLKSQNKVSPQSVASATAIGALALSTDIRQPTHTASQTRLPEVQNSIATSLPIAADTATLASPGTSTPSQSPPPTPGPGIGTPFGAEQHIHVIHRVKEGQGWAVLSKQYGTSEAAIRAANGPTALKEGQGVWPDMILVIPVGKTNPAEVVRFEPLFTERKTSVQELAEQFTTLPEAIRRYNLLGEGEWIPAGRWLIIPLPTETPE